MKFETLIISLLWGVFAAVTAWYIGSMAQQITYITLADGRRQERRIPIIFRILMPLTPNFFPLFKGKTFDTIKSNIQIRILSAGYESLINPNEHIALHLLMPIFMGTLWVFFVRMSLAHIESGMVQTASAFAQFLGVAYFTFYPTFWLKKAMQNRHRAIQRSLPFVMDLLTLSVEAGMDFMSALQRNVERRKIDALGEELIRVIREIQLGKTRKESLRNMSDRVNLPDLRSVVNALIQADELGVSIGSILRIQATQIRQRRFEHAEKLANEAPVKMLFPLMFFIFPSVFLILMGPVIVQMLNQFR